MSTCPLGSPITNAHSADARTMDKVTTEQNCAPISVVGPVRYDPCVYVPADLDDDGEMVEFTVNALALPRVGDELTFGSGTSFLLVQVTSVSHWFASAKDAPPRRSISVIAHSLPASDDLVRRLRTDTELDQWISQFRMLEKPAC